MHYISSIILGAFLLSGCSPKQVHLDTSFPMEDVYEHALYQENKVFSLWWKSFGVVELDEFIGEALENNHDILVALEKMKQAQFQAKIAGISLFPSASFSASSASKYNAPSLDDAWKAGRSSSLSLGVSYELDVWGKLEATNNVALASLRISEYDKEALKLSLIAGLITSYFQYSALNERMVIAHQNLENARQLLRIVEARYEEGSVSALDVSSQRSTLLSQELSFRNLESNRELLRHTLALLSGKKPEYFKVKSPSFEKVVLPQIDAGIPSEILFNRPDIASARAQLKSAEASIYAADAKRFPSFSLNGSSGLASNVLLALRDPSGSLGASLGMAYSLFDAGNGRYEVEVEESKASILLHTYHKTILTALKEVEDSLYSARFAMDKGVILQKLLEENERSLALALEQYKQGFADFSRLLEAQRSFYQMKDQMVQHRLEELLTRVSLYKVLGGGWRDSLHRE